VAGTPEYDPYTKKNHFYDPDRPRSGAVCGRSGHSTVYVDEVDCPDCINYIKQYLTYFLDHAEACVARLLELEDEL
jgi:hypothetical protein